MAKNENCTLSDSAICMWLNKECKSCYINGLKSDEEAKKVLDDFMVTLSLLPEDFDDLQGEECQFCKGEKKKRAGYAVIDLANSEPEHKKGMFFGMGKKVKQKIGSLMPTSISICRQCRRSFRIAENMKWFSIIFFAAIGILLIVLPPVSTAIMSVSPALPYGILIICVVIGFFTGKLAAARYMKAKIDVMRFNVFDIPVCVKMKKKGWFTVQDDTAISRFIFSKKSFTRKIKDIREKSEGQQEAFVQTSFLNH